MHFKIEFYETSSGKAPAYDFIMSLRPKLQAKMLGTLQLLSEFGAAIRSPFNKCLGDNIFELRCQFGSDSIRVLYFFHQEKAVVLTNGFFKKTQRTPAKEIRLAKKYRKDYLERTASR